MPQPRPEWLRVKIRSGQNRKMVEDIVGKLSLHTVCSEANCPNLMECFDRKTATFMILGNNCTRNCAFCNVTKGETLPPDPKEPENIAQAVKELDLKYAVITSVTRDDLPDGGAGHFVSVIEKIRQLSPDVIVEVLIPDFKGSFESLKTIVLSKPNVINHNVETVPRLYPSVRSMADYPGSLDLIRKVKIISPDIITKSGMMVGMGEHESEVLDVFRDLRSAGCDLLTIGQYLAPSKSHHPVVEYIHPEQFEKYKKSALEMGFHFVASAPLVRSSYHADKTLLDVKNSCL